MDYIKYQIILKVSPLLELEPGMRPLNATLLGHINSGTAFERLRLFELRMPSSTSEPPTDT